MSCLVIAQTTDKLDIRLKLYNIYYELIVMHNIRQLADLFDNCYQVFFV